MGQKWQEGYRKESSGSHHESQEGRVAQELKVVCASMESVENSLLQYTEEGMIEYTEGEKIENN